MMFANNDLKMAVIFDCMETLYSCLNPLGKYRGYEINSIHEIKLFYLFSDVLSTSVSVQSKNTGVYVIICIRLSKHY